VESRRLTFLLDTGSSHSAAWPVFAEQFPAHLQEAKKGSQELNEVVAIRLRQEIGELSASWLVRRARELACGRPVDGKVRRLVERAQLRPRSPGEC